MCPVAPWERHQRVLTVGKQLSVISVTLISDGATPIS
nr:MAG TPA: hypothetical protein [Caudoviricetes sp.]